MKIFLDCGAWTGTSVDFFRKYYPNADEFKIYCFECLPENLNKLYEFKNIMIIPKAIWITNCKKKFYTGLSESGSLDSKKKTGGINPDNFIIVDCIDIVEFIKENFTKNDYIIMKLNIESAEYNVIQYLFDEDLIGWIDKWYIEWHWAKIGMSIKEHNRIKSMIPKNYSWPAMFDCNSERFKSEYKNFVKSL